MARLFSFFIAFIISYASSINIYVDNQIGSLTGDGSLSKPFSDLNTALAAALGGEPQNINIFLSPSTNGYFLAGSFLILNKNISIETSIPSDTKANLHVKDGSLEQLNKGNSQVFLRNLLISLSNSEGALSFSANPNSQGYLNLSIEFCEFKGTLPGLSISGLFVLSFLKTVTFTNLNFNNINKDSNSLLTLFEANECENFLISKSNFTNITANELRIVGGKVSVCEINTINFTKNLFLVDGPSKGLFGLIIEIAFLLKNSSATFNNFTNESILIISGAINKAVLLDSVNIENNKISGVESKIFAVQEGGNYTFSRIKFNSNNADHILLGIEADFTSNVSFTDSSCNLNQAYRLLEAKNILNITIDHLSVINFNNIADESTERKGAALYLENIIKMRAKSLNIDSSYSILETTGLIVTKSIDFETSTYEIIESKFTGNLLRAKSFIKYPGCAVYISGASKLVIDNILCSENKILSGFTALGGPCVYFDSVFGNLTIANSLLNSNIALKSASAIEFVGYEINLTKVSLINNAPQNLDYSDYTLGAVNFQGVFLYIVETRFNDNIGSSGLFFIKDFKGFSLIIIKQSVFTGNKASYATILNLDDQSKNRTIFFSETKFVSNKADTYGGMVYVYIIEKVLLHNITFQNCEFIENESFSGTIGCIWIYSAKNVYNNFLNSTFTANIVTDAYGFGLFSVFGMEKGLNFTVRFCNFTNNIGVGGTIYYIFYVSFSDYGSIYLNNYASSTGSIFFALYRVIVDMSNVEVKNASSNSGGFMFATEEAELTLKNLVLDSPKGEINIFDISSFVKLVIRNMTIKNPILSESGAIFSFKNNGDIIQNIENLSILNYTKTPLVISEKSQILFKSFTYTFTEEVIFKVSFSSLWIIDAVFPKGECNISSKGCLIRALDSSVTLERVSLSYYFCAECIGIIYMENSDMNLSSSKITYIKNNDETAIIYAQSSKSIAVSSSEILKNFNLFINGLEASVKLHDSKIEGNENIQLSDKPVFYCELCGDIEIVNNSITGFQSGIEAAGIVIKMQMRGALSKIENNKFSALYGKKGGALFVENSLSRIIKNEFISNLANQGGAAYFSCLNRDDQNCNMDLKENNFVNNTASIDGGALKWQYKAPTLDSNKFKENTAISGGNVSGFPLRFAFKVYNHDSDQELEKEYTQSKNKKLSFYDWKRQRNRTLLYDSSKSEEFYFVDDQLPGKISNVDIELILLDAHNQVINHDIGAKVDCELLLNYSFVRANKYFFNETNYLFNSIDYLSAEVRIFGTLSVFQDAESKRIIFENINFVGAPTTLTYLKFSSPSIIFLKNDTFNTVAKQHPNEVINETLSEYSIIIPIIYSECKFGELYKNTSNSCSRCPPDYYTFSIKEPDCLTCPDKVTCLGGADMVLAHGYWRKSNVSTNIIECTMMMDNCVGGMNNYCASGYTGYLCGSCTGKAFDGRNLQRTFEGKCVECLSNSGLVFIYILFWALFIFILFYISNILTKKCVGDDNDYKIIFRIWINYLQVGLIMQSYQITIAKFLKDFEAGQNLLKALGRIWFSIECVLQATMDEFDPHLESLVVTVFVYAGLIVVYMVNRIKFRAKLSEAKFKEKIYICIFLLQPFFIDFLAGNISCIEVEGENRLKSQPEKLCYTESYYFWLCLFYIPNLAIWGLILSFIIVNNVKKHLSKVQNFENAFSMRSGNTQMMASKSKLENFHSALMSSIQSDSDNNNNEPEILGEDSMFLWIGYRPKVNIYIWEIMNWGIKCAIILINQLQMNHQTKYLILLYIVSHYIIYQTIFNPYRKRAHNWLEKSAKYSLIFISQTLLFLTFDLDKRLYDFSMAFSVIIAVIFTTLSLAAAFKRYFLRIDWIKRRNWAIFR